MIDLLLDPTFEIVDRGGRQIGLIGPKVARAAQIDVDNVMGLRVGIPVDQHAYAALQPTRHIHLVAAEQGRIQPTQLTSSQRRIFGRQITGGTKDQAGNILWLDAVEMNQQRQQTSGLLENCFGRILVDSRSRRARLVWA